MNDSPSLRDKIRGVRLIAGYKPEYAGIIVGLNLITAVLEGVGIGLIIPIIEIANAGNEITQQSTGVTGYYTRVYDLLGVPFTLETILIGLTGLVTVRYGLAILTSWMQVKLRTEYICHLRMECFRRLLNAKVAYLDTQNDDDIINVFVTEITRASGAVIQLLSIVQTLFFILVYVGIVLFIAPIIAIGAIAGLGAIVFCIRFLVKPGYDIGENVAEANERIQRLVNDGLRGIREIRLFNMSEFLTDEFRDAHNQFFRTNLALARNQVVINNANQWLNVLGLFSFVYLTIGFLNLSFASLSLVLLVMLRLSPQISSLNDDIYNLDGTLPHLLRSRELMSELDVNAEKSGTESPPEDVTDLQLDGVSFQYGESEVDTGISDISLEAARGETVALVGPSGAGKSTVISLIARLYIPDKGSIFVNGSDLSQFDMDAWQEQVAIVQQHPFIFNRSLRENITIGNSDASQADIQDVCEISEITSFLNELPAGLDTQLGDDGVRLSGGQRQRVAIARALLTDADILLLDEATSELDRPTEEAILSNIDAMERDYLTIVIGHWLSTIQDADRIYTIADGEVVETGTHQELISNDSHYADLYNSQLEFMT